MKPGQTTLPGARSITSQSAGRPRAPIEATSCPSIRTSAGAAVVPIPSATRPPRSSVRAVIADPPLPRAGPGAQPENLPGRVTNGGPGTSCGQGDSWTWVQRMTEQGWLAEQFERTRPHLEAVAYSMLGSVTEAQDAVQEAWLRLGRSDTGAIEDLRAWLTTVVGRICLDMLKARQARREDLTGTWCPEPLFREPADDDPEGHAVMAESVGLALL